MSATVRLRVSLGEVHRWGRLAGERRCGDRAIALILYGAADRSPTGEAGMAQKITVALEDDLMAARRMRPCGSGSAAPSTRST
jgi:hypothetical protein